MPPDPSREEWPPGEQQYHAQAFLSKGRTKKGRTMLCTGEAVRCGCTARTRPAGRADHVAESHGHREEEGPTGQSKDPDCNQRTTEAREGFHAWD